MRFVTSIFALTLAFFISGVAMAQDDATPKTTDEAAQKPETPANTPEESLQDKAEKLKETVEAETERIAKEVDKDPRAIKVSAGILDPIYVVAENLSFPAFHWLAFALMSAGVVSYVLQLAIGKLVVLMRMGFSLKEILSDLVGLAISVIGLVLTTQAAAENSSFTQSPAAVISATVVGAVGGIILYLWGQSQEIQAAAGRTPPARSKGK
jgi:hypothetical protein